MHKLGPIIVIDDDKDDIEIYKEMFERLQVKNEVIYFTTAPLALEYLRTTTSKPFVIICDVNMPVMSGFELREFINTVPKLNQKCIPFLFFSTGTSAEAIQKAYELSVQGIFKKPASLTEWAEDLRGILLYWSRCLAPVHNDTRSENN